MHPHLRVLTEGRSHFFGFHDLTPWDPDGSRLVALRTATVEDHVPAEGETAEVVVIDELSGDLQVVGETEAWNWQQAARQRWLDRERLIFNVRRSDGFGAQIVDVSSGERHEIHTAVNDVSPAGGVGLGVDFVRLHRLYEPYGYAAPPSWRLSDPAEDGLFSVELASGEASCILTIEEVARRAFGDVRQDADFFTHPSHSPSGRRVSVLHRRIVAAGALSTNLVVLDLETGEWKIIADDRVSHLDWEDDEHIVVWCRRNRAMRKMKHSRLMGLGRALYGISKRLTSKRLRRNIYRESFRRFDVTTGHDEPVGLGVLDEDGHPMVHPHTARIWVNDTYPDARNVQTLMLFDSIRNERTDLIRLPTPAGHVMTGWRCDLHPRWDPTGTRICIDSAHRGTRQVCIFDASEALASFSPTTLTTA